MIEGSGSGSIPLTNGSGSRRPKKMWVRIRNTAMRKCRVHSWNTTRKNIHCRASMEKPIMQKLLKVSKKITAV
jgi:hypothetical protein